MSKQIMAGELASIVTLLLTTPPMDDSSRSYKTHQAFMTEVAELICKFAGGEVRNSAAPSDDVWYVGIHGNELLAKDGGIWRAFDIQGQLWDEREDPVLHTVHGTIDLPLEVRLAVDRMCIPLDTARLDGATADADSRCMATIKSFVDLFAQPAPVSVGVSEMNYDKDGRLSF